MKYRNFRFSKRSNARHFDEYIVPLTILEAPSYGLLPIVFTMAVTDNSNRSWLFVLDSY